jgi:hypothetical protein
LSALQKVGFLCRDKGFCALLKEKALEEDILEYIQKTEAAWD